MPFLYGAVILGGATAGIFKLMASGAEDAGQAVDAVGSGALKLAIAAGGTYVLLKKMKVI